MGSSQRGANSTNLVYPANIGRSYTFFNSVSHGAGSRFWVRESMSEQRQTDLMVDETYVHMKRLAASYLQLESSTVTLSPTVLVHEAYVKLSKQVSDKYQSRGHFLAIAAMVMRKLL